jgi:L-asparaginase
MQADSMARARKKPRLALIAAGGTISMLKDPETGESVSSWAAADLLAQTPLAQNFSVRCIDLVPPYQENLANQTRTSGVYPEDFLALARRIQKVMTTRIDGVVVTHGTDAMEEAAYCVDEVVASAVPIVFTGAMRPGWATGYDGIRNLENALRIAAVIPAEYATLVTLNDQIFEAWSVYKADTGAFDAFSARRGAPFGRIFGDQVACPWRPIPRQRLGQLPSVLPSSVPILTMGVADDGALLERLVDDQIQGLVIAGMASGTIPEVAYQKVLALSRHGLPIVLCSSATSGWTNAEYYYPTAYDELRAAGVCIEDHLSARKARIRLMVSLGLGVPYVPFGQEFGMSAV